MTRITRAKSTVITPKMVNGFDNPRQLSTGRHTRTEHDYSDGFYIDIPDKTVEIQGSCFWYVETETNQSHPALGFPTLANNLSFELANWRGQYFNGNASGVESAPTDWINGHNVSGKNVRMGYIDGGTGWYVDGNGMVSVDFLITRYDSTRIALHWNHMYTRRNAASYPAIFEFMGIIPQPISSVSQVALSVMGQRFKGVTSYTII